MFERKGYVKVALDAGDGLETRRENLIETALENGAEDFEEGPTTDAAVDVEVEVSTRTKVAISSIQILIFTVYLQT